MPFIPLEVYANNPSTTVSSGGTTAPAAGTTETWTVASSTAFPAVELGATQFHVCDPAAQAEIITVQNIAGATWTVQRGAESSPVLAHASGFTVVQVVTAGSLAQMQYSPWQFPVQFYGTQGDGKIGTGGTGTAGSSAFSDAGATFVNAPAPAGDVGKVIVINQGTSGTGTATGTAQNPFCGTITAVTSATSVTLSGNLLANCANAPYIYGTDDAAAINQAISAAANWAVTTGNYKAQVVFAPQNYMLGALTQSTSFSWAPFNAGSYVYNTHIPVPFTGQYARKLIIDLVGVGDASEPDFWGTTVPSLSGTCLVSAVFGTGQPNATYGSQSVIGAPSSQTGIGTGGISGGGFANVLVNVNGISVVAPWNSQQHGLDFRFAAQANVGNASYLAFAPVNYDYSHNSVGGPYLNSGNIVSNGISYGLAMPMCQNNDNCNVGLFSCEGAATGLLMSEHTNAQRLGTLYCNRGIEVTWQLNGTTEHGGAILYWTCEACNVGVYTNASPGHMYSLFIGNADFEVMQGVTISDSGNNLTGTVYWFDSSIWSPAVNGVTGGANWNIVNCHMVPGVWAANAAMGIPAPPAAPATGVAQQNTAYRQATVYASATTSITSFGIGPSSGSLTSITVTRGANVAAEIRVPSGWWYSVTYSGTLTTTWLLE